MALYAIREQQDHSIDPMPVFESAPHTDAGMGG